MGAPLKIARDLSFFVQGQCLVRAGLQARLTRDALVGEIDYASLRRLAKGAAAPYAAEGTALEKDHRADARSIFQHVFGEVENDSPLAGRLAGISDGRLHEAGITPENWSDRSFVWLKNS
jgi:hypothetical protein